MFGWKWQPAPAVTWHEARYQLAKLDSISVTLGWTTSVRPLASVMLQAPTVQGLAIDGGPFPPSHKLDVEFPPTTLHCVDQQELICSKQMNTEAMVVPLAETAPSHNLQIDPIASMTPYECLEVTLPTVSCSPKEPLTMQAVSHHNTALARQLPLRFSPTPLHRLEGRRRHWLKARLAEKYGCSPLAVELLAVVPSVRPKAGFDLQWNDSLQELQLYPLKDSRRRPFRLVNDCLPQTWVLGRTKLLRTTPPKQTPSSADPALFPLHSPDFRQSQGNLEQIGRLIQLLVPTYDRDPSKRDLP